MMETTNSPISRRGVLKSLGFAGAAVVTTPIISSAAESVAKATSAFTHSQGIPVIGMIVPSGKAKVGATNLLNGFQLYCTEYTATHGCLPFSLIVEETGIGAASVHRSLSKLTHQHHIALGLGIINTKVTEQLGAELDEAKVPFLELNHGENFFHKGLTSEYVFQSSLNLWQSNYTLGIYAARELGKEAVAVGSFADASFDAHYAFEAGFVAGGGTVSSSIVTGSPTKLISPIEAATTVAASAAPVVFCNYSGHDGALFLSKLQELTGGSKQVVASGVVSQPAIRSYFGNTKAGAITAHSWQGSGKNDRFSEDYRETYSVEPTEESVLGYDTAKMLCSIFSTADKSATTSTLISNLKRATLSSARGPLSMNVKTHSMEGPISIYKIGMLGEPHSVLATMPIPDALSSEGFRLVADVRSGAIVTYPYIS